LHTAYSQGVGYVATTGYLLAGEDPGVERRRLQVLERLRDPLTVRRLWGAKTCYRCDELRFR
jgi:hypothetical protein